MTAIAHASCGLDLCLPPQKQAWTVSTDAEVGHHELLGQEGMWSRTMLGLGLTGKLGQASISLPYVAQWVEGAGDNGFGNAMIGAQWDRQIAAFHPLAGAQLELPIGGAQVAHPHGAVLPYVGVRVRQKWSVDLRVGGRVEVATRRTKVPMGLPSGSSARVDHTEEPTTTAEPSSNGASPPPHVRLADPHQDLEMVARASAGPLLGAWSPAVTTDLASNFDELVIDAGAALQVWVHERVQLRATVRAPLTSARRFDWRSGLGAMVSF